MSNHAIAVLAYGVMPKHAELPARSGWAGAGPAPTPAAPSQQALAAHWVRTARTPMPDELFRQLEAAGRPERVDVCQAGTPRGETLMLAIRESVQQSDALNPERVRALQTGADWDTRLAAVCARLGVAAEPPGWWLCAREES